MVGTIIGSGIFLVPQEMMQAVGSARIVYLAWLVGGLLSFFGALTYAELGAMKPQAGGEYVYVRDAYGPLPAFLYGWTWFLIAKPASIATVTTGLVRTLGTFPVFAFFSHAFFSAGPFSVTYGQLVAIAAAIFITVAELHRHPQGRRISVPLHASENRHHPRHRRRRLQLQGWILGQFLHRPSPAPKAGSPASSPPWSRLSGPTTAGTISTWSRGRSGTRSATFLFL